MYIMSSRNEGIFSILTRLKVLSGLLNTDFSGGEYNARTDNAWNVMTRTGFVMFYAGFVIHYCSNLYTEIAFSASEAKYSARKWTIEKLRTNSLCSKIEYIYYNV